MFLLIESIKRGLTSVPDLGTATLLAMVKKSGFQAKPLSTQSILLKSLFFDSVEEIHGIIADVDKAELKTLGFSDALKLISLEELRNNLQNVYNRVFPMDSVQKFLDTPARESFDSVFTRLLGLYDIYLRKTKSSVQLIQHIIDHVKASQPDVVGFSVYELYYQDLISAVLAHLKQALGVPIIVGGPLTPYLRSDDLRSMINRPDIDYIVQGQADFALPKLLGHIAGCTKPSDVENLIYVDGQNVAINPKQCVNDLDQIEFPDYSDFALNQLPILEPMLPVQTSRGCSWGRCAFCNHELYARHTVSYQSPEKVLQMLLYLEDRHKTNKFILNDAEVPPWRYDRIADEIIGNGYADHFSIMGYGRLEKGFIDNGLVSKIRKAGFNMLQWGLESGNQRVLNLMRKGIRVNDAEKILRMFSEEDIVNRLYIIIGFPGESQKEAEDTLAFIDRNRKWIDHVGFGRFQFVSHSPIALNPEKWGVKADPEQGYIPPDNGMSHGEINRVYQKVLKRYSVDSMGVGKENFRFFGLTHATRYVLFLLKCYKLLENKEALLYLNEPEKWKNVYPFINTGSQVFEEEGVRVHPVDYSRPPVMMRYLPSQDLTLTQEEFALWSRCNGVHSLSEIHQWIEVSTSSLNAQKMITLLEAWIKKGYCLIFSESWPVSAGE